MHIKCTGKHIKSTLKKQQKNQFEKKKWHCNHNCHFYIQNSKKIGQFIYAIKHIWSVGIILVNISHQYELSELFFFVAIYWHIILCTKCTKNRQAGHVEKLVVIYFYPHEKTRKMHLFTKISTLYTKNWLKKLKTKPDKNRMTVLYRLWKITIFCIRYGKKQI